LSVFLWFEKNQEENHGKPNCFQNYFGSLLTYLNSLDEFLSRLKVISNREVKSHLRESQARLKVIKHRG